jgi:hypothetical protein
MRSNAGLRGRAPPAASSLEAGLPQSAAWSDVVQEGEEGPPAFVLPGGAAAHRATFRSDAAARAIRARSAAKTKETASDTFRT